MATIIGKECIFRGLITQVEDIKISHDYSDDGVLLKTLFRSWCWETEIEFNSKGKKLKAESNNGLTIKWKIDESGNEIIIDENNFESREIDENGVITVCNLDINSLPISCKNSCGTTTHWTHDTEGNVIKKNEKYNEPLNAYYGNASSKISMIEWMYNKNGEITSYVDDNEREANLTYDSNGNKLSYRDNSGFSSEWEYDDNGNKLSYSDSRGVLSTWKYDDNGNKLSKKERDEDYLEKLWTYKGNRGTYKDQDGLEAKIKYDDNEKEIYYKDNKGYKRITSYYESGELFEVDESYPTGFNDKISYFKNGIKQARHSLHKDGHFEKWVYNENKVLISNEKTSSSGVSEKWKYNESGKKISYNDSLGNRSVTTYDERGNKLDFLESKANGVWSMTCFNTDGTKSSTKITDKDGFVKESFYNNISIAKSYDETIFENLVDDGISPANANRFSDGWFLYQFPTCERRYDGNDNLIFEKRGNYEKSWSYDSNGLQVLKNKKIINWSPINEWSYNNKGDILTFKDYAGFGTEWFYDSENNNIKYEETHINGVIKTWIYDQDKNLITWYNNDLSRNEYTYNDYGVKISETLTRKNQPRIELTFNVFGNPTSYEDAAGLKKWWVYDEDGNVSSFKLRTKYGETRAITYNSKGVKILDIIKESDGEIINKEEYGENDNQIQEDKNISKKVSNIKFIETDHIRYTDKNEIEDSEK